MAEVDFTDHLWFYLSPWCEHLENHLYFDALILDRGASVSRHAPPGGLMYSPGHANVFRDGNRFLLSCHHYDGTERGRSSLSIQQLSWSKEGWPVIGNASDTDQASSRIDQLSHASEIVWSQVIAGTSSLCSRKRRRH